MKFLLACLSALSVIAGLPTPASSQAAPPVIEAGAADRIAAEFLGAAKGGQAPRQVWIDRYVSTAGLTARTPEDWRAIMEGIALAAPDVALTSTRQHGPWLDLHVTVDAGSRQREISLRRDPRTTDQFLDIFATPWPLSYPKPADGWPIAEPELGQTVRARIAFAADHGDFSGAALVARGGQPILRTAYGHADRELDRLNSVDGRFILASAGKMFTAVVIAQLIEEGRLTLNSRLGDILPEYPTPQAHGITVRQLLSHSAGLGAFFDKPGVLGRGFTTATEAMAYFAKEPLQFAPGTAASYSNEGFVVLGAIIERLTGQSYYAAVEARVFHPLGMTATGYASAERVDPALPRGYVFAEGDHLGLGSRHAAERFPDSQGFRGGPAGGAFSTVDDMAIFMAALMDGRLIKRETLETLLKPEAVGEEGYALGFEVKTINGRTVFGHSGGSTEGADARVFSVLETGDGYVLLGNYAPPVAQPLSDDLTAILAGARP